jgi:uracil-DNA glycosylase
MDERRRRAWAALGIGPAWLLRDPPAAVEVPADAVDTASLEPPVPAPLESMPEAPGDRTQGLPLHAAVGPGVAPTPVPPLAPIQGAIPEPVPEDAVTVARSRAPAARRDPAIAGLSWPALSEAVAECRACGLCEGRRHTVFGTGPRPSAWMLVGEAPGQQEDLSGEPFVGDAGRLLDQMLRAIGIDRPEQAFIANVLKCRPPGNRDPLPEEVARCEPFLLRQVELIQPRLIVVLGRFAAQSLLRTDATVGSLRGRVHAYRAGDRSVPMVVTYHPAYLLRNLPDKAKAWADLRLARRTFDAQG